MKKRKRSVVKSKKKEPSTKFFSIEEALLMRETVGFPMHKKSSDIVDHLLCRAIAGWMLISYKRLIDPKKEEKIFDLVFRKRPDRE